MKILKLLLIILCFSVNELHAQSKSWILTPNFSDDIANNLMQPLPITSGGYQGQTATGAQNIITNSNDEIMFFIVDEHIYGRNGELIAVFELGGTKR